MTCREMEEVLPGLAEREGTPRVALESARHLASCAACAETLLRLRAMGGMLDRLPKADVPAGFARRVLRALPVKGGAITVLVLLAVAACFGASSLGVSLAWLSSILGDSFESATGTFAVVIRLTMGILTLVHTAGEAFETSSPALFALSPHSQFHGSGLLIVAVIALIVSGAAFRHSRFRRSLERTTSGQPIS